MVVRWRWLEGPVDETDEHLLLTHGPVGASTPIARVSVPTGTNFRVKFLSDAKDKARAAVREELDFYLVEKQEADPWLYAKYHCGTAANIYSNVHWEYHSPASPGAELRIRERKRVMKGNGPKLRTFTFGGCVFGATSPEIEELSPKTPMLNVTIPFEEALKLHLAIGECIRKLNTYNRSTKAGKRTAVNLAIHLNKRRITINETNRQQKQGTEPTDSDEA